MNLFNSKKARMAIAAVIVTAIGGLLATWQIEMPPEVEASLIESVGWIIAAIIGVYLHSQGGVDKEKAKTNGGTPIKIDDLMGKVFKHIGASGLQLTQKRQPPNARKQPETIDPGEVARPD